MLHVQAAHRQEVSLKKLAEVSGGGGCVHNTVAWGSLGGQGHMQRPNGVPRVALPALAVGHLQRPSSAHVGRRAT